MAPALALLLLGSRALAEPTGPAAELGAASGPSDEPAIVARIVLIGRAAADPELPLLLGELLEREGVAVAISRAERFERDELLASRDDGVIRVFVLLGDSNQARLRFRGPNGERYLLRTVTLSNGLDAVGRELLGQVVESSVVALLRSTEGMSRKEVTAELERDDDAEERRRAPATPPLAREPRAPSPASEPAFAEPHFGVRYLATWSGPDLGLSHGPGVELGARLGRVPSVGLELGADRRFAQSLSTPSLDASVGRTTFHALLEVGLVSATRHRAFLAAGPALELTKTRPLANTADVTPAPARSELEPALRAELRYELALGHFVLGAAALLEVSFVRTRYELVQAGRVELLGAPAPVRPGAALTLAVRP